MSQIVEKISKELQGAYSSEIAAINQANSLKIISSDIYTEEERFIYELLQNAVDSFSDTNREGMDVKITLKNGYLAFMHNGAAFSDADVEGICGIGNGTKAKNSKKIGYKGIGFKSVFAHSENVIIKSGGHCFAFDKAYWTSKFKYEMPWQIIPLPANIPFGQDYDNKYDVCTYIKLKNYETISKTVLKLFENSDFLLFLGCKNVCISYYLDGTLVASLRKLTNDKNVTLYKNNRVDSQWLVHSISPSEATIPENIRELIAEDENTPEKLKNSWSFDLSFAISLDQERKMTPIKNSVVYTYLPTSVSMGLPFLVNANFITDAGRQQLHINSEWNKFFVSKIPGEFLMWVSTLSRANENFIDVLPLPMETSSPLSFAFNGALSAAINDIAFIPTKNSVRKANEVFMDRMGIASQFSISDIVEHINREYSKSFDEDSLIGNKGGAILKKYGVFSFDKKCFKKLFDDEEAFANLNVDSNERLIRFLHSYYDENISDQSDLLATLKQTKFLMMENGQLASPTGMLFPSIYYEEREYIRKAAVLNSELYYRISDDNEIVKWLSSLGLEKASDISVVRNVICEEGFINEDNAIDVGRFLFGVSQKEDLFGEISDYYLQDIKFLSKQGTLMKIDELYLGHAYNPDFDIEPVLNQDIYVSEDYIDSDDDPDEWKIFLKKMGISASLNMNLRKIEREDILKHYSIFSNAFEQSSKKGYPSYNGNIYYFYGSSFSVMYFPLVDVFADENQHDFGRLLWSHILTQEKPSFSSVQDYIIGYSGIFPRELPLSPYINDKIFAEATLSNLQRFPSVDGRMLLAREMFLNSQINIELIGAHLPMIDLDSEVDESWLRLLPFKRDLSIDNLLSILTSVAEDDASEEKERVGRIYNRIADCYSLQSDDIIAKIRQWGDENYILSTDGRFIRPTELSYITIGGFNSKQSPYFDGGSNIDGVIELLHLMGVTIITPDNIHYKIGGKVENKSIPTRLKSVLSALALIKCELGSQGYDKCTDELSELIDSSRFFQCESIILTYGDDDNTIEKNTFASDGCFYYTSSLRAATIEPLLSPLCNFLGIEGKERELFILLIELDMDGIKENLKEKGYDVDLIEDSGKSIPSLLGLVEAEVADENERLKKKIAELEESLAGMVRTDGAIIGKGDIQKLEHQKRIEAQLEAQRFLKSMKPDWEFPQGYGEMDADGNSYCDTRLRVTTLEGEKAFVLKSHKVESAPFKITVMEWDYISDYHAKIFVYTGTDIKEIDPEDLIRNQSSVSVSFSTKNLDVEERIREFAHAMHYFKELHFDFESFDLSAQAASIRGMYNKHDGFQVAATDDDI